jgi:hypothetical protein
VHGTQTKHHGRIARVLTIGERRLSVSFEDGLSGKFVGYTDAVLIPERGAETSVRTPTRLRTTSGRTVVPSMRHVTSGERSGSSPGEQPRYHTARGTPGGATREYNHQRTFPEESSVPTNSGRTTEQRWSRATFELHRDREWRRRAESDASDNNPDDDYSLLEADDDGAEEQSIPALVASLAIHWVLYQFSITAATLITQHAEDGVVMERLLQQFVTQVRLDVDTLAPHSRSSNDA